MEGPAAVDAIVGQLEGFEAAASAWESEILPARLTGYELVLARRSLHRRPGRVDAAPPAPGSAGRRPQPARAGRATPIALFPRRCAAMWSALTERGDEIRAEPQGRGGRRVYPRERRLLLRRAPRGDAPAPLAGRGSPVGAGRPWPRHVGQFRRVAGAPRPLGRTPARSGRAAPAADGQVRHGGGRPLGAHPRVPPATAEVALGGGRACRHDACSAATASSSGASSNARPNGCRPGASSSASIAGSRTAARSAAAASSPASPASSSPCPRRSASSAGCAGEAPDGALRIAVGRRSAQPRRHRDAGREAAGARPATASSIATVSRSRRCRAAR